MYGSLVDVAHRYREIGVPYVRLHDPNWPHPREVDIPQVFPDFGADPEDRAAYDFARTDAYLQRIVDTGAQIIYRLGVSIEHTEQKTYTHPPPDFDKWARICLGIVKHYNYGWANGYRNRVAYWEVWNEADIGDRMWTGTFEQYFDLYERTSKLLKAYDSSLQVGGPATAKLEPPHPAAGFLRHFLAHCQSHRSPLDFVSWHKYTTEPQVIRGHAQDVERLLSAYGYANATSHLNEWNYTPFEGPIWEPGQEVSRRAAFERQKSHEGAAFVATTLAHLQDSPVDVATYYDGQPSSLYCGIFDYYGVPQKAFYAFKAFNQLCSYSGRLETTVMPEDSALQCLAAGKPKDEEAAILIARFAPPSGAAPCPGSAETHDLKILGLRRGLNLTYTVHLIDRHRCFDPVASGTLDPSDPTAHLVLGPCAVALITLTPTEART
ncbi:MAG: hypothetical protein JXC32_08990 [Anaerolineae bacterium]|nr:hypothetical protein [Anaerolineae bacterium]